VVCAGDDLVAHLRVAGAPGPEGLIPTTARFGTALGNIVRCQGCGHMQLDHMPPDGDLEAGYAQAASEDYIRESAGQRATAREALRRIEEHVAVGTLLDIGAWTGYLVAEADRRGWQASGLEPSEFASRYARESLGVDVRTSTLEGAELNAGHFDAITMGDVIEHLPAPGETLERIVQLLAPGGVLWLALPDAGSRLARTMGARWWSVLPTHVQYFTRSSLSRLLASHGFEVLRIDSAPKAFTIGYYLGRLEGYSAPLANVLVRGARLVRIAERLWSPDFGDRMMVLARAPHR